MATFTIEVRDSDGNDCTVYDYIVEAEDKGKALDMVWAELERAYPDDESDGGDGTYHPCDCVCDHRKRSVCGRCRDMWECSHGGLLVSDPEDGDTSAPYHIKVRL